MSEDQNPPTNNTVHIVALLIFVALVLFIPVFLYCSKDISVAIETIWEHLKDLSLIVAGYLFGRGKNE